MVWDLFNNYDEYEEAPQRRRISKQVKDKQVKELLYSYQKGRCMYCGKKLEKAYMDVAHKTPLSRGGADALRNFQMLCGPCNRRKGGLTDGEFRKAYGLPRATSPEAKSPPKKAINQTYFEAISKKFAKKAQTKRRRQRQDEDEDFDFGNFLGF